MANQTVPGVEQISKLLLEKTFHDKIKAQSRGQTDTKTPPLSNVISSKDLNIHMIHIKAEITVNKGFYCQTRAHVTPQPIVGFAYSCS